MHSVWWSTGYHCTTCTTAGDDSDCLLFGGKTSEGKEKVQLNFNQREYWHLLLLFYRRCLVSKRKNSTCADNEGAISTISMYTPTEIQKGFGKPF